MEATMNRNLKNSSYGCVPLLFLSISHYSLFFR
ncbi:hypothetical protein C7382_10413 [Porphyromonas loveana]|uniref:Uncharacterized protein n=1 Tax=Porphyromonas loveana TaxID=1884669 RepID=A0A2U1FKR2_9PORP|nr:hypothetical protein C7382_10413 [Porphyromonas loveana]